MYGNTEAVARAIADGVAAHLPVEVVEVGAAPTDPGEDLALLVVGGPTHAFGMSRPKTRRDAAARAGRPTVSPGPGVREWLEALRGRAGVTAAAFDTRVVRPRVPGSAARAIARRLRRHGLTTREGPHTFWVTGSEGPLLDGELERARAWGAALAEDVAVPAGGAP
ncbi:flavodoxin family protein [Actinomycetospora straminea]|nr:flavodoxin family protein [Actinomycetospora straminea]MDD7933217.1 flavodoxin family protein [Actinomycetospora straminea]